MFVDDTSKIEFYLHGSNFVLNISILGLLLKQHKIYIRIVDAVNMMYKDFCTAHGLAYRSVDRNGKD